MLVVQLCPPLCNPMDCSPPGSSVHEILQARILEWVAILFARGSSWPSAWTWVSCIAKWNLPSEPPRKPPPYNRHPPKFCSGVNAYSHAPNPSLANGDEKLWSILFTLKHSLKRETFSSFISVLQVKHRATYILHRYIHTPPMNKDDFMEIVGTKI